MTEIEHAIRRQAAATVTQPDLDDVMRRVSRRRGQTRRVGMVASALLVVLGVAGVVLIRRNDGARPPLAPPTDVSAIVISGAGAGSSLDRSDVNAAAGAWSVVVRRTRDGSLGAHGAVVTFPVGAPAATLRPVRVGDIDGSARDGAVIWPIAGQHAQVHGDLAEGDLIRIAAAVSIVDGHPALPALEGMTAQAAIPYRAASVHEVRYGSTDVGEAAGLGNGLTYTGVFDGASFEDQLFDTRQQNGYTVQGHPAVVSDVQGGNASLAWEPAPGLVAYVGYSGAQLDAAAITSLVALAERTTSLTAAEWEATRPQVVEQQNGPLLDHIDDPHAAVGCSTTPDQPAGQVPAWASENGSPAGSSPIVGAQAHAVVYSFVRPLVVVAGPDGPLNKVAFVTDEPADQLTIVASLDGRMTEPLSWNGQLPAGGSSTWFEGYLHVDAPGCWQFDITFAGRTDTFHLSFR